MGLAATFLVLRADRVDLGLPAAQVARVVDRADWTAAEPADVEQLLGVFRMGSRAPAAPCARVLILKTPGGEAAVGTARALLVREILVNQLCELPPLVSPGGAPRVLARVAQPEGAPPLLEIDPAALCALAATETPEGDGS